MGTTGPISMKFHVCPQNGLIWVHTKFQPNRPCGSQDIPIYRIEQFTGSTHQQNDRNVKKIELKTEGYRDAPMTPRDHFMKKKLGVKGPLDFT